MLAITTPHIHLRREGWTDNDDRLRHDQQNVGRLVVQIGLPKLSRGFLRGAAIDVDKNRKEFKLGDSPSHQMRIRKSLRAIQALDRTMKSSETMGRLTQQGTEPVISAPDALANQIRMDISTYRNLIHDSGISIE